MMMETGVYKQNSEFPPSYSQSVDPRPPNYGQSAGVAQMTPTEAPQQSYTTIIPGNRIPPLGPRSTIVTCPNCQLTIKSLVRYEVTTKTHLIAAIMCAVGLFCCACCAYCMDTCKNPNHYCPHCDTYLGTYKS